MFACRENKEHKKELSLKIQIVLFKKRSLYDLSKFYIS